MATHEDEKARPAQAAGKETQPAGASKSPQIDADEDPQRVTLTIDQRADDSGDAGFKEADKDRPRDGT